MIITGRVVPVPALVQIVVPDLPRPAVDPDSLPLDPASPPEVDPAVVSEVDRQAAFLTQTILLLIM